MKKHLSPSFFNSMLIRCQAQTMAIERGEIEFEKTKPILVGGYVDAHFAGTLDQYIEENKDLIISKRTGKRYSDFSQADDIIKVAENDPIVMRYLGGEQQREVKCIIDGVEFIGRLDSYFKDKAISELKVVKSIRETTYNPETKNRENFIQSGGYLNQCAIYQESILQETGKRIPCYIVALSKEKNIDKEVIFLPQWSLDFALDTVKSRAKEFLAIRTGKQEPIRCETCAYCRSTRVLTAPMNYESLL